MSKREERRGERRATILETAGECFLDKGYAGTTMSAVAARLGGSKPRSGTIFPQGRPVRRLYRGQDAGLPGRTGFGVEPGRAAACGDRGFCRSFAIKIRTAPSIALYQLLCGEAARAPEASRIFSSAARRWSRLADRFLGGHVEAGRLRGGPALEMAHVLISLCTGVSHQRMLLGLVPVGALPACLSPERIADLFFRLYAVEAEA
jgi:hypothetical protein